MQKVVGSSPVRSLEFPGNRGFFVGENEAASARDEPTNVRWVGSRQVVGSPRLGENWCDRRSVSTKWVLMSAASTATAAIAAVALADPGFFLIRGASASGRRADALVVTPKVTRGTYSKVTMEVRSSPPQRVVATYVSTCKSGMSYGRLSGERIGRSPLSIAVRRDTSWDYCRIVAEAKLAEKGRVTLLVIGHR